MHCRDLSNSRSACGGQSGNKRLPETASTADKDTTGELLLAVAEAFNPPRAFVHFCRIRKQRRQPATATASAAAATARRQLPNVSHQPGAALACEELRLLQKSAVLL